ncbi:MAG: hypothetical protein KGL39_35260 [Patescibacteria group bacterium]|nr:hypothetical protein [Patescibacteria group bacterium]
MSPEPAETPSFAQMRVRLRFVDAFESALFAWPPLSVGEALEVAYREVPEAADD